MSMTYNGDALLQMMILDVVRLWPKTASAIIDVLNMSYPKGWRDARENEFTLDEVVSGLIAIIHDGLVEPVPNDSRDSSVPLRGTWSLEAAISADAKYRITARGCDRWRDWNRPTRGVRYEGAELLQMMILDIVQQDFETASTTLLHLNPDERDGGSAFDWLCDPGRSLTLDEVIDGLLVLSQHGLVNPSVHSNAADGLVVVGAVTREMIAADDVWFMVTPLGQARLDEWDA